MAENPEIEHPRGADPLADDEATRWTLQQRRAARKDPRHAAILSEITAYTWPNGEPMVPSWQDHMATYVMAAVHSAEAGAAEVPAPADGDPDTGHADDGTVQEWGER